METNEQPKMQTIRKLIKILSVLSFVIVFCPTFLVSCSAADEKIGVSAIKAFGGFTYEGEMVEKPHVEYGLCLILPIVIFIIVSSSSIAKMSSAISVMAAAILDAIVWTSFKSATEKLAKENMMHFETTIFYTLNMGALALLGIISAVIAYKTISVDGEIQETTVEGESAPPLDRGDEDEIGICRRCGAPITSKSHYCENCGLSVSDSILKPMEPEGSPAKFYCKKCGAVLDADSRFCVSCGLQVR